MPHFLPSLIADPLSFAIGTFVPTTEALVSSGMKAAFLAGGWELITDGSGVGPSNAIIVQSQRAPWWDHDATPPATWVAQTRFRFFQETGTCRGQLLKPDGTAISTPSNLSMMTNSLGATYSYNICPFQAMFMVGSAVASLLVSVLASPKFEQEAGLENLIIMARDFHSKMWQQFNNGWVYTKHSGGEFSHAAYESINQSGSLTLCLYRDNSVSTPMGIYNRASDPTMIDPTVWFPFMSPAVLAFSDSTDGPLSRGWLWNALVIGKGYAVNKIFTIGDITLKGFTNNNFGGGADLPGTLAFVTARN